MELSKQKEELNRIMEEKLMEELQVIIRSNFLFLWTIFFCYRKYLYSTKYTMNKINI